METTRALEELFISAMSADTEIITSDFDLVGAVKEKAGTRHHMVGSQSNVQTERTSMFWS